MISVKNLVKRYGGKKAVDDLSFEVQKGEIVGFLGPNGAGKSTTLRILSGFLGMTSGTVSVAGHDIVSESFEARKKLGYMPEAVPLYPEMRVSEYLGFRAELKQVPRKDRREYVDDAMKKANVEDVATMLIGHLSKGYKQRVGLADALVSRPPLLVLDEPTAGLDPNQIREVRDVIKDLAKEHTVLLSTHILSEVEASCSRVVVIDKGKLVAEGTLDDLAKKRRAAGLVIVARGNEASALSVLRAVANVARVEATKREDDVSTLRVSWGRKVDAEGAAKIAEEAIAALAKAGLFVREARPVTSSLEELFAELTRGEARPSEEEEEAEEEEAAK